MPFLLSSDILFEIVGPLRDPVRSWMEAETTPREVCVSVLSIHWVLATINAPDVVAARRASYSANIPLWRLDFKQLGGRELEINEDVLKVWHQIYQSAAEHDVHAEEALVLATAITYDLEYVCFDEPWLEYFSREFGLQVKAFDHFSS